MENLKKPVLSEEQLDAWCKVCCRLCKNSFLRIGARRFGQSSLKKFSMAKEMWLDFLT